MSKVLSKQLLLTGKIFKVERWHIQTELKQPIVRDVVLHPPVVVVVAINDNGEALLTHEYRVGVNHNDLGLPAGFIEKGETPKEAAKRELREETGYEASTMTELGSVTSSEGFTNERAHLMLAHFKDVQHATQFDSDELVHTRKVPFKDLVNLVLTRQLAAASAVSAILLAERKLNTKKDPE